jgi:hypothetical protein
MVEKLKEMMEQLIAGEYDCNAFSYDFPDEMFGLEDETAEKILDDMPEICSGYDPFKTDDDNDEILNDKELIKKVKTVYDKLIEAGY